MTSTARLVPPGLAMIAVTYGLARFAYGLFLPQLREAFDLPPALLGIVGAGSYVGYCVAVVVSLAFTSRTGPRLMAAAAGAVAVVGMATVAAAPAAWVLALGVLVAGSSTGLASPPMGEAVANSISEEKQDRANTLINSGTSLGVALSGPAALLAAEQWRVAWATFTAVGVAVLVWNVFAMPGRTLGVAAGGESGQAPPLSLGYLFGWHSMPLLAAAGSVGFASAAYWTFSRDLVVQAGQLGETGSTLFWTAIGVSGVAGAAAGDLVGRFGLDAALKGSLFVLAVSIALLGVAPGVVFFNYASAVMFGAAYITLTGVVLVWSVAVFPERPSAGLGAGFLLVAVGQAVGSPVAGALAGATSLQTTFLAFASLAVLAVGIRANPKNHGPQSQ